MKDRFCIVIPIYKKNLDCTEIMSLERLSKMTRGKGYPMFFIKPKSLNCRGYYRYISQDSIREIEFDDEYFKDTKGYSQLCLSYDFYDKLSIYQYMYIYQLDCYLFEDNLQYWVDLGYDYIGAPILATSAGWDTFDEKKKIWEPRVGNGGFSLRKIDTFKELTDPNGEFRTYYNIKDELIKKIIYEDKYFCNDIYDFYELNVPDWIIASKFSFDMNVDIYKKMFNIDYNPMGVHAWPKNIRHWKDKMEELKNDPSIVDFCEEKYKDFFEKYYDENNSTMHENKEEKQ